MQEFIENMQTGDYEQEGNVQAVLDICGAYINQLEINLLQPAPPGSESNGEFQVVVNYPYVQVHVIPCCSTLHMTDLPRIHRSHSA